MLEPASRRKTALRVTLIGCALTLPAFALPAAEAAEAAEAATACSDFDSYVNGAWAASATLPPDRARIGSFDTLHQANDKLLEAALAELAAQPGKQTSPGLKLLARYYRSGMNESAIEHDGLAALGPLLTRIDTAERDDLPRLIAALARVGVDAPLALGVGIDAKDATRHVLAVNQSGLGLPDRNGYFRDDADARRVLAAYRRHAATLLAAADTPADDGTTDALLGFERELASASMTRVQRRDPLAVYNPLSLAELEQRAPGFD